MFHLNNFQIYHIYLHLELMILLYYIFHLILEKKETQNIETIYTSNVENYIVNNVVFCHSSIIKNPDNKHPDKNVIITFFKIY